MEEEFERLHRLNLAFEIQQKSESVKEMEMRQLEQAIKTSKENMTTIQRMTAELESAKQVTDQYISNYRELKQQVRGLEEEKVALLSSLDRSASATTEQSFMESTIRSTIQDLNKDYVHGREEMQKLSQDIEDRQDVLKTTKEALQEVETIQKRTRHDLDRVENAIVTLNKQNQLLERQLNTMTSDNKSKSELLDNLELELVRSINKQKDTDDLNNSTRKELEEKNLNINIIERQIEIIERERELLKHQMSLNKEERIRLDASVKATVAKLISSNDALFKLSREKDNLSNAFHREESLLSHAQSFLPPLRKVISEMEMSFSYLKAEMQELEAAKKEVKKTIDFGLLHCLDTEKLEEKQANELKEALLRTNKTQRQMQEAKDRVKELGYVIKKLELEKLSKAYDMTRLSKKLERSKEEMQEKRMFVDQLRKGFMEVLKNSRQMEVMASAMKTEKNNYLSLIQWSRQVKLETIEKEKLIKNEFDIVIKVSNDKNKNVEKAAASLRETISQQSILRADTNNLFINYRKKQGIIDKDDITVRNLQTRMESLVKYMQDLRDMFEVAADTRDRNARILLERNDEICLLYEKLNISERKVRDFDRVMAEQDHNTKHLRLIIADLERTFTQLRQKSQAKPEVSDKWNKLRTTLKTSMEQEQRFHDLFDSLFEARSEKVLRVLGGRDKSKNDIAELVALAEQRYSEKERLSKEKTEAIRKIEEDIENINKQYESSKLKTTQIFGNDVNHWRKTDSELDQKIIALISEMGMYQTMITTLKTEVAKEEAKYKEALARLSKDQPPDDEIAFLDKIKSQRSQIEKDYANSLLKQLGFGPDEIPYQMDPLTGTMKFPLPDGRWTTAAPRPVLGESDTGIFQVYKPSAILHHHTNDTPSHSLKDNHNIKVEVKSHK